LGTPQRTKLTQTPKTKKKKEEGSILLSLGEGNLLQYSLSPLGDQMLGQLGSKTEEYDG